MADQFQELELDFDFGKGNGASATVRLSDSDGEGSDSGVQLAGPVVADYVTDDSDDGIDESAAVIVETPGVGASDAAAASTVKSKKRRLAPDALDRLEAKKAKRAAAKAARKAERAKQRGLSAPPPCTALDGSGLSPEDVQIKTAAYLHARALVLLSPVLASVDLANISVVPEMMLGPVQDEPLEMGKFARQLFGYDAMFDMLVAPSPEGQRLNGAPRILVVTSGGLRAANLVREFTAALRLPAKIKAGKKVVKVAKLFAKHFKIAAQTKYLSSNEVHIAVGTPNRLLKLLQASDGLHTDRLAFVLFDTVRDAKDRTLFDMHGVALDAAKVLAHLLPLTRTDNNLKMAVV